MWKQKKYKDFYKWNPIYEMGRRDREREISEEVEKIYPTDDEYIQTTNFQDCKKGFNFAKNKVLSIINNKSL